MQLKMSNRITDTALIFISIILFLSCNNTKNMSDSKQSQNAIEITAGEGGGFTGQYIIYRILPDSFIYSVNSRTDNNRPIEKLTEAEMNQVYTLLDESNYEGIEYNEPGNMSEYVDIKDGATQYRITWEKGNGFPPKTIKQLHQLIFKLAKNHQHKL